VFTHRPEQVGERLATAAMGVVYGSSGAYAGPTIAGCSVGTAGIIIKYNASLLRGGTVGVKKYDGVSSFSAMRVLVDSKYWCSNTTVTPTLEGKAAQWMCSDDGAPDWGKCGGDVQCGGGQLLAPGGNSAPKLEAHAKRGDAEHQAPTAPVWVLVDVASKSDSSVILDLSKLPKGAQPIALRYAWDNDHDSCCKSSGPTKWCEPAACPIWDTKSGLPGNPFIAAIQKGKCKCISPQRCDA
jgi:hypothetical protein